MSTTLGTLMSMDNKRLKAQEMAVGGSGSGSGSGMKHWDSIAKQFPQGERKK